MISFALLLLVVSLVNFATVRSDPVVRLSHGGELRGLSLTFLDKPVDFFQGVRYAQPPTGDLRFKKPVPTSWKGVVDAKESGNVCPHLNFLDQVRVVGDEDCLFLHVTVPGSVKKGLKKAVMFWIHGGGYSAGSGRSYVGAPLAVFGDVIVVTINHRLGPLGFLYDGPGTGNFGLWDQRAAMIWVQENIEQFGGDPDRVTIFGESAGGGSISAHTQSPHSEGLFRRAIQESGTLFLPWSWDLVTSPKKEMENTLRQNHCPDGGNLSIYECLRNVPLSSLLASAKIKQHFNSAFKPTADGDFFPDDINVNSYLPSQRFDLMSGVNGQEGLLAYAFELLLSNASLFSEGISNEAVEEYVLRKCRTEIAPLSPQLCLQYITTAYELNSTDDDFERTSHLIEFLGDHFYGIDITFNLEEHSESSKSTYAYYFTKIVERKGTNTMWPHPSWNAQVAADHADEVLFVFGTPFLKDDKSEFWTDLRDADSITAKGLTSLSEEEDKALSKVIMQLWSNFAKSGNPNEPTTLAEGIPVWPEFNKETNIFLELNSNGIKTVTTPNKERKQKLRQTLYADRELQRKHLQASQDDQLKSKQNTAVHHEEL
ncbi:acylcarnitine hydrolase-like [Watersipora subatra]|uniref:acylcarnitine hydrolase-like n=1 Tax=Watersipora subatra TaxID=2589382 RepID=UPI00355C2796